MDIFPENFTRKICMDTISKNQIELVKKVRKTFYDKIIKSLDTCESEIELEFPDKLWHEHKITLIEELIIKFGKIKVKTINSQCEVLKLINDKNDIPRNVKKVSIEFVRDE